MLRYLKQFIRAPLIPIIIFFSLSTELIALIVLAINIGQDSWWYNEGLACIAFLGCASLLLILMLYTHNRYMFYASKILRTLFLILSFISLQHVYIAQYSLLLGIILELSLLEAWPVNFVFAFCTIVSISISTIKNSDVIFMQVSMLFIAFFASYLIKLREKVITTEIENIRSKEIIVELTQANTQYQSLAVHADTRGRTQERNRITRDIHDIVGYTLTNNIMLMEHARDMMHENPLGIPSLIESARQNAEEGLGRIRKALYSLRAQEDSNFVGIVAIHHLIKVYSEATKVEVNCNFALDTPIIFAPEHDEIIYHLIQESLINAFRHGRATKISVALTKENQNLLVCIIDNGSAALNNSSDADVHIKAGLGLTGMRERINSIGGSLTANPSRYGFEVRAHLPL